LNEIKPKAITPLRTPGGKSKVVKKTLSPLFPDSFNEFYEPFIGGGSVALWIAQMYPDMKIHINDLNPKLYIFWKVLKTKSESLIKGLHNIRQQHNPKDVEVGKLLLQDMQDILYNHKDDYSIAIAYYVLNKISFSGLTEHGSLSKLAYEKTFNDGNIDRLIEISSLMKNFEIYNLDFEEIMKKPTDNDFTFLDPPYQIDSSNLYGKKGELHSGFDHEKFLQSVKLLKGKWMITYNDNEWLREVYKDYKIIDAEYRYCMSFDTDDNGNKTTRMKNELIIVNY
jgi:DNA adenine methylase